MNTPTGSSQGDPLQNFTAEEIEALRAADKDAEVELLGYERWLRMGAQLANVQTKAMRLSNSQNPIGRRYADMWKWLIQPFPHLARIASSDRTAAIWLHSCHEAVTQWRNSLTAGRRDSLNNPRVVRKEYEKANKVLDHAPPGAAKRDALLTLIDENDKLRKAQEIDQARAARAEEALAFDTHGIFVPETIAEDPDAAWNLLQSIEDKYGEAAVDMLIDAAKRRQGLRRRVGRGAKL
jgi:hypothetical protein